MTIIRSDDLCNCPFSLYWYRFTFPQYSSYDKLAITGFNQADAGIPLAYNSTPYISNHIHTHHSFTEKAGHRFWNSPGPWPALCFIWLFFSPSRYEDYSTKKVGVSVSHPSESCRKSVGNMSDFSRGVLLMTFKCTQLHNPPHMDLPLEPSLF